LKISGFSFVRNGAKLYYPVAESIKSILPIVDEFVIAVGKSDDDDDTRQRIVDIGDPKVKIIDTVWEERHFKGGIVNSIQTDIAKNACSGDWLFYLQADEVVHEKYLPAIQDRPDIHSWQSAQSFRRFDYYDNPRQESGHHKLNVAKVDAEIYHYGWVRPPHLMQNKRRALDGVHWGLKKAAEHYNNSSNEFDYGPLNLLAEFKQSELFRSSNRK